MLAQLQGRDRAHVAVVVTPGDEVGHPFIETLESAHIPLTGIVLAGRRYLAEYRALSALAARLNPEVVHTHGYREDVIGGAIARAHGIPTVSTVHGFTGVGARNFLNERIQRFALRRADAVLAVSQPLVSLLRRSGILPEKIHLIPNAFVPPHAAITRGEARRILGVKDDQLVAGWVGRLSREKGPDVMLDALARADSSWCLAMIGEGPESERLKKQARELRIDDRVLWRSGVVNAGALMPAFDAFVLSSRTEGTPIALFEAIYANIPVVAAQVGGIPFMVTREHALLVPPEEPLFIAGALASLRREPASARVRTDRARERLLQNFAPGAWVSAVEEVYRLVLARSSTRPLNRNSRA